ncbi:MDR family MFS transporter [Paenarthrobacter nicotinovorans]|uniref:MDR family MFS transporter n=1 Tax=Paenarthrobacter nicotinovorans TaxID=29320 RepID=UPI003D677E02
MTNAAPASNGLTYRQTMTVLSGLLLGMFLAGLDQTVVATAARTIGDDLGGLDQQAWLTTAFLITSTITTLLYGKLSDIFGRKRLYMIAIALFIGGSALCGLATSMPMLAAFRAVQGLGAGGLMSLAFAIIGDIVPPRERAKYQGYFAATMALSSVLGPVVGGLFAGIPTLVGIDGWRWVFWVNLPIGLAALLIVAKTLHVDQAVKHPRVDYLGAALVAIAVVPALLVGEQGSEWGWASAAAIVCYVVAAAGAAGFIWRQIRMGTDALLPLGMFRSRAFSVPAGLAFALGLLQLGGVAILPLYLQISHAATPTESGLLMLPMVLGISGASVLSGIYTSKTGRYKILPILGMALLLVAYIGLVTVHTETPVLVIDIWMLLLGVGTGMAMNTTVLAMQNAVAPTQMGIAVASGTFFRNLGGTTGTAVLLSVLFSKALTAITASYTAAENTPAFQAAVNAHPEQAETLRAGLAGGLSDTSFLTGLDPALARPFIDGFAQAMNVTAIIGVVVAAAGFVLALFMREKPLSTKAGNALRAEAAVSDSKTGTATEIPLMGVESAAQNMARKKWEFD